MADFFLQFSEVIPNLTDEEAAWFAKYIDSRHKGLTMDGAPMDFDDDGYFPDFQFAIKSSTGEWGKYAWFSAEESGSVRQVAEVAQEFLKKFRPDGHFSLTWAEWTNKLRVGQFDGGGLFVTATEISTFHAAEWVHDKVKSLMPESPPA